MKASSVGLNESMSNIKLAVTAKIVVESLMLLCKVNNKITWDQLVTRCITMKSILRLYQSTVNHRYVHDRKSSCICPTVLGTVYGDVNRGLYDFYTDRHQTTRNV
jgi:hypothetical protein